MALDQSTATVDGMRKAKEQKAQWAESIASGRVSFAYAVEQSRTDAYRYISKLKLIDILMTKSGWTFGSALEILDHHGFTRQDNLQSIRKSPVKIEKFEVILHADRFDWRARPKMPERWPWRGKLAFLVDGAGQETMDSLVAELGLESDAQSSTEESRSKEQFNFDQLMGDDDE